MEAAIAQKVQSWLDGNFDENVKNEIRALQQKGGEDLADAFYRNLEFGTGGLRGIMGIGTNRMNKYTVGMATQGFANYMKASFPNEEIKWLLHTTAATIAAFLPKPLPMYLPQTVSRCFFLRICVLHQSYHLRSATLDARAG